jgi:PEP-CTERM motif
MTKKRFKLSMAALGLLAAFFMALLALLLAPNLASANRDPRMLHHAKPGMGHPHGGSAPHGFAANANEPGHGHGNAVDAPFCVDGGVYPCALLGDTEDEFGGAGGYSHGYEYGYGSGGNPQGGAGSSNGNGPYGTNFWGGNGAPGGGAGGSGAPGGGVGDGGSQDGNKAGTDESGNPDDDKTKDPDPEVPFLTLTPPGDDGEPSGFVDPDFGDPKTEGDPEDGPKGEEPPPITEITVTEVPEPLTLSLFAVGLVGAARLQRNLRRRSRQD